MKFRLTTPIWKVCATLCASAALVFSFQNCGKAGFDSGLDEGLAQSSTAPELDEQFGKSDGEKVAAIPFAYDLIIDQIAYNSCTGSKVPSTPGFFTFKLGAYSTAGKGGLKVREDFATYVNKNFKPVSPALYLSDLQIKNFLAASPENKGARPQFAIRGRSDPQQVRSPNTTLTVNNDYFNILGDLTNDRFMHPLVQTMVAMQGNSSPVFSPIRYFPYAVSSVERNVETAISYNSNEAIAHALRADFAGGRAELAMTYTSNEAGDEFVARGPIGSTDSNVVYGRAYIPTFSIAAAPYTLLADSAGYAPPLTNPVTPPTKPATRCPNGSCQPMYTNPNNIMTGMREVNLESTATGAGATWNCDPKRRYVIVKASDAAACPKENYAALGGVGGSGVIAGMNGQAYRDELEIVRRTLRSEDWDVNIQLRCAVPKASTSTCYPDEVINGVSVAVEYDQTMECFQGVTTQSFSTPATPPTRRCAQYISICTRGF